MLKWKYLSVGVGVVEAQAKCPLRCVRTRSIKRPISYGRTDGSSKQNLLLRSIWRFNQSFVSQCGLFSASYSKLKEKLQLRRLAGSLHKVINCPEKFRQHVFVQFVVGVMVVMSVSVSVSKIPSCKFTFRVNRVITKINCARAENLLAYSLTNLHRGPHRRESSLLRGMEDD